MFPSPSTLPEKSRSAIIATLNARLADGLDLHSQVKVAHWNIKGPQFAALHPLLESFAVSLATHTDAVAERAVTLGGFARGTSRHVAKVSHIPDYPQETTRDLEHVALLADRFDTWLVGLRESREIAGKHDDHDTADLLTEVISDFEKYTWFLRATLG